MTRDALKKEETKHIGRKLFQYLYKILLLTGLLTEPINREEKRKRYSTSRILPFTVDNILSAKYCFEVKIILKMVYTYKLLTIQRHCSQQLSN